jgi:creatinine amidohydrolase/Fe(II)-dependent formamide hydrolase-like protein
VDELFNGVREAGLRKLLLFNTSPGNEAFLNVAARDNRIRLNLQVFCLNLWALGIKKDLEGAEPFIPTASDRLVELLEAMMVRPFPKGGRS